MNRSDRKITVEDLLRIKRAERPPPEFWSRFESEIRAKQLAAIVVRRPWWDGASRVFAVVYRNRLPFGATAALALAWAGVHYEGGLSLTGHAVPVGTAGPTAAARAPVPRVQVASASVLLSAKVEIGAPDRAPPPQALVVSNASHLTKAPVASQTESASRTPFVDGIEIALVDFRATGPDLAKGGVFGSDREFEASVASVHQPAAEPLTQMDPAGERLERLLAPALPTYSSSGARAFASDRLKQKASYDRMYESMDRYGAGGMSLEFRF
ncbi:MAG TPA: hypothetical protein VN775_07380 [Opitutaceae bacterium]|nr:hypothetical protein [Opitutaceae bacterium]